MAGLFPNLLTNLRLWFCAKQVVANVQALDPARSARLSLMVALFRAMNLDVQVPGGSTTVGAIVQHPTAYRAELCYAAFRLLGEMRQAGRDKIRNYESFKIRPSAIVTERIETCDLALSLLMSTVGVGCRPGTLEAVKFAWETVAAHAPTPADIDVIMKMPEYITNDIMEQPLETDRWLALAHKGPDFLKRTASSYAPHS